MTKYVQGVIKEKRKPDSNSFEVVNAALNDELLKAKLAFFQMIASQVEPFLSFKSNAPLSPLLYEALLTTLKKIMMRVVKAEVLNTSRNITTINLKSESNLINAKEIELGFAVKNALCNSREHIDIDILRFRQDCRKCLIEFCVSLTKSSPLLYALTKGISCFDPTIAINPKLRLERLDKALDIFVQNNWLTGSQADNVKNSYTDVCKQILIRK